ncbi:hypothetical protein ACJ41O_000076 [Fusarium nematophilum]
MHPTIVLVGLAAVIPAALAEELRADDVPSACTTICQPIVDLTTTCDIDPEEADPEADTDNDKRRLRLRQRDGADEAIEAECICTNKSFDVEGVMALCASCMAQNSDDSEDHVTMLLHVRFICALSYGYSLGHLGRGNKASHDFARAFWICFHGWGGGLY